MVSEVNDPVRYIARDTSGLQSKHWAAKHSGVARNVGHAVTAGIRGDGGDVMDRRVEIYTGAINTYITYIIQG